MLLSENIAEYDRLFSRMVLKLLGLKGGRGTLDDLCAD